MIPSLSVMLIGWYCLIIPYPPTALEDNTCFVGPTCHFDVQNDWLHNGHVAQVKIMGISSWALFEVIWMESCYSAEAEASKVRIYSHVGLPRRSYTWWLINNRNLFLTLLELGKSKIKVLAMCCLLRVNFLIHRKPGVFAVFSHGGREQESFLWSLS